MKEGIICALLVLGTFFVVSATLGALRFPDVFSRVHAITKAGTLGVGLVMSAAAVYFGDDVSLVTRAVAVIFFTLMTSPASAQMIGRASYLFGWHKSSVLAVDELADRWEDPLELFSAEPDTHHRHEKVPEEH